MADRKGVGLFMVAIIASAAAAGIGVYSIVNNSSDSKIVAIWDDVSGSGDDFFLNISDNQINNRDYCYLADGNTRVILTKIGWYGSH